MSWKEQHSEPLPDGHRLRVRFITRKWAPAVGGMETYCLRLTEHLKDVCEVEIIALPGRPNGASPSGSRLILFGLKTALGLVLKRRKADVTHIADMASWPLGLVAAWSGNAGKVVLSAHGSDVRFAFRTGWRSAAYQRYLGLCRRALSGSAVIANSTATAEALRQLGFQSIHVIPLAADGSRQVAPPAPKTHLLFAGRILPQKGLSWFVNFVLPLLPSNIQLHVAGTIWDQKEADCLKHDRVRYIGPIDYAALQAAYREAFAVIIPNLTADEGYLEGFGLVAVEAAAAGAVVLSANSGGLSDAVIDGETGFLLPCEDQKAWATKTNEVFTWDESVRSLFLQRSQELCQSFYSWERVAKQTIETYKA